MRKKIKVLMTASGAPGWVPLYKCLISESSTSFEIYGCDISPQTAGSYYSKKHFLVPRGDDANFITEIEKITNKEKIDVIIPLADQEVLQFARHRTIFQQNNIALPVSKLNVLELCMNKKNLLRFLQQHQIGCMDFQIASNWREFTSALTFLGYPKKPICFKPTLSWGSRGFRIIDPSISAIDIFLHQKPTSTYISFQQAEQLLKPLKDFPELVVMEYLPGDEYTVDAFIYDKEITTIIPRRRIQMKEGITIEGITEKNEEIIKLSKKIFTLLDLEFAVGIQWKYDADGNPKVLEIHGRLQGTSVLSYAAGVNLPYLSVRAAMGQPIPKISVIYGVHMFRHWQEVFSLNGKKLIRT